MELNRFLPFNIPVLWIRIQNLSHFSRR
uniref:Uncharacterized protein n=1 Tax=Arundo donax TaxID=35708 RepID=A0A0A9B0K2_ARUDO